MAVEADEYELPIAVADTAEQLGKIFGLKKDSVINSANNSRCNGRENGRRFVKIADDGEEGDGDAETAVGSALQRLR